MWWVIQSGEYAFKRTVTLLKLKIGKKTKSVLKWIRSTTSPSCFHRYQFRSRFKSQTTNKMLTFNHEILNHKMDEKIVVEEYQENPPRKQAAGNSHARSFIQHQLLKSVWLLPTPHYATTGAALFSICYLHIWLYLKQALGISLQLNRVGWLPLNQFACSILWNKVVNLANGGGIAGGTLCEREASRGGSHVEWDRRYLD